MKKEILIEIIGTQRLEEQKDKIELTTVGSIEEDEEAYTVRYTEEQEPPLAPIQASVKIRKDETAVEMIRTGACNSCLLIERSKRNLCRYGTDFGDILMGIFGRNIEAAVRKDSGTFHFDYDIDVNGALTSRNEVIMNFKSNQEQ